MVATNKDNINKELPKNPKKYIMTDREYQHILNAQAIIIDNLMEYNTHLLTNLTNSINNQMTHRENQEERQNEMMNKLINIQIRKNMLDSFSKKNDNNPTLSDSSATTTTKKEKEDVNTYNNFTSKLEEILDKILDINNKTKVVEQGKKAHTIDMVELMKRITEAAVDSINKKEEEEEDADEPFIPNNDNNYERILGNDI